MKTGAVGYYAGAGKSQLITALARLFPLIADAQMGHGETHLIHCRIRG